MKETKIIELIDKTIKKIDECNQQIKDLIKIVKFYKIEINEDNIKNLTKVFKRHKKNYK